MLAMAACASNGNAEDGNKNDAAADAGAKEKSSVSIPAAELSPETFLAKVTAAGGRLDFVFEDDRPFAQCHASTVVEAGDGALLSAWFAGTEEKNPDVGIWGARFSDGAWSAPARWAKISETAHWNPVLFRDAEGVVYLFFKVGVDVPHWSTYWMQSTDGGTTWSAPKELVAGDVGGRGPVKNPPIILSDGAWLAPASTELGIWKPFADRSEDHGKTWQRSADWAIDRKVIRGIGAIQPTFWESQPGHVHALMRTAGGCIARADSTDGGRTWTEVRRTGLPNNNSGIDTLGLEDGRVLLVYNPIGLNWGPRTPLHLAVSEDNGVTWHDLAAIETEEGEFSYPTIVRTRQGVAVVYTWKRLRVRCWQIPLDALQ
ncbi:MAG TPA: exo-alpha-sialidase [Candidatus Hydrogenedentes bacterium]|nr:exo-alpha-sialidase [Candidatus Hydrogenedentota bacterium]